GIAQQVIEGGRAVCHDAGIPLAGGHSIDAPEPIFGLAVTGLVPLANLKRNDQARAGSELYLSTPLGIGILTTAQQQTQPAPAPTSVAARTVGELDRVGADSAHLACVNAMTDVAGFGLLGHLLELCEGSHRQADIWSEQLPLLPHVDDYLQQGCVP